MKDVIIGCINNYTPEVIKPWVESIIQSGFQGDKVVISFGLPTSTINYLLNKDFQILESSLEPGQFIHNRRFLDIWNFLETKNQYRYVITTDVKDVIFQKNPSEWLENNLINSILVSSEYLKIQDEEWNNKNILLNYPHIHNLIKDKEAYNVGVLAGKAEEFKHFCLQLYHFILTKGPTEWYADQAAFNCLIHMNHFQKIIQFSKEEENWNCQLGTTLDPKIKFKYSPLLLEPAPNYKNGEVFNSKNEKFYLVHQYDRIPELKEIIINKYS